MMDIRVRRAMAKLKRDFPLSQHVEPNWKHIDTATWSTGCLCDLNPAYAVINKWNSGAANVDVDNDGEFHVNNFRISGSGEIW